MDDLTQIARVGPATVEKLNGRGITSFAQIAELTDDQVLQLNEELELRNAIIDHDWRAKATELAGAAGSTPQGAPRAKKAEKAQTVSVRINRDFWDAKGERHRKGTVIDVSVEEALDGAETGALSRVKG